MQQARQSTGTRPYPGHSRHCEVHSARQAFSSISTPPSQKSNRLIGIRSFNNGYRTTYSHSSKSDVASDHKSTGTPGKYIRLALSAGALLSHDRLTALLHFLENRPDTETLLHRSVAMHVLLQPVLPATFRIVYPSRDSKALAQLEISSNTGSAVKPRA